MEFKIKVLIIENDKDLSEKIKSVLLLKDYDVCCTDDGFAGIQKAFEFNPDAIICSIKMEPLDGYHVYNVLKETSLIDRIPFIFMIDRAEMQTVRYVMDLGADDIFVKSFDLRQLVKSVEERLVKFRKIKDIGRREFDVLFNIAPYGIFLFDGHFFIEANPALIKMLGLNKASVSTYSIVDFLDTDSYHQIKDKILSCTRGLSDTFAEQVTFISITGEKFEAMLYISPYEKYSGYTLMVGLVSEKNGNGTKEPDGVFVPDILKLLERESINVSENLGKKLTGVIDQNNNLIKRTNGFFTEREYHVLKLSMEGLPTKLIADKLSISDRTVEKHRSRLMEKTKTKNMIEVIVYALKNNLINIQ